ncbi:hypothetical protein A7A76_15825 [Lysobacter enzymogenes]|nr:hypothetical protein [Lysobacter enzymogenes]
MWDRARGSGVRAIRRRAAFVLARSAAPIQLGRRLLAEPPGQAAATALEPQLRICDGRSSVATQFATGGSARG